MEGKNKVSSYYCSRFFLGLSREKNLHFFSSLYIVLMCFLQFMLVPLIYVFFLDEIKADITKSNALK